MNNLSVITIVYNEEENIRECLESVKWADEIIVVDSFSTDRTVEIARAAGVKVVQRRFDTWSCHQNWAVRHIEFKHRWVCVHKIFFFRCSDTAVAVFHF